MTDTGPASKRPQEASADDSRATGDAKKQKFADRRQGRNTANDRRRGTRGEGDAPAEDDSDPRLPKRRVAILFGYCGVGYSGLQVNPGVKTIEGDIFDVLCKAGCVSKDNAVNPNKVSLQRAARTDRGVHAAGNLLNLKLILNPPSVPSGDIPTLVKHLNEQLPPLIRIWSINRVQSSFNARSSCDSRYYQYLLPTYVFLPPKPGSAMWKLYKKWADEKVGDEAAQGQLSLLLDHPFWSQAATTENVDGSSLKPNEHNAPETAAGEEEDLSSFKKDTSRKRQWRLSEDESELGKQLLPRIRSLWSQFLGTKNFHNYTVGKSPRDPSAKRCMKELNVSDPFIVDKTEYVSLTLHGQSFMLHQIRKMVGLLVLIARSPAPEKLIAETYQPGKIHVPKAPALGLLLNSPVFQGYNNRIHPYNQQLEKQHKAGKLTEEDLAQQRREEITFDPFKEEMEAFRMKHIYQTQYETEEREDEFAKWLNYLDSIVGNDFEYLSPKGTIPKECYVGAPNKGSSGQPKAEGKATDAATASTADSLAHHEKRAEDYQASDDEDVLVGKAEDLEG